MGQCHSSGTLHDACHSHEVIGIKQLLNQGFDVNVTRCLHICVSSNVHVKEKRKLKCLNILLRAGADTNVLNSAGWTPLMVAAFKDSVWAIRPLVEAGCDVHKQDNEGNSALTMAVWQNRIEAAKVLIQVGANVDETTHNHIGYVLKTIKQGNIGLLTMLIKAGSDVNQQDETRGATAAHLVLLRGNKYFLLEVLQLLVDNGADINIMDYSGYRPIHWAIIFNERTAVRFFLAQNVNINSPSMSTNHILDCISRMKLTEFMEECGYSLRHTRFHSMFKSVPPLKSCCRKTIRRILGSSPDLKIKSLPLPGKLINYLRLLQLSQEEELLL